MGKVEYEKRWCKYDFTVEELGKIAENLAMKTQELEETENEKKSVMTSYKDRLERVSGEIRVSARLYKDRYEMRDIECEVQRDLDTGEVLYIRTDTGDIVHRDKMTMVERQRRIEELLPNTPEFTESDARIRAERQAQRTMSSETSQL